MYSDVKSLPSGAHPEVGGEYSSLLALHLILSIAILGSVLGYAIAAPFFLISFFSRPLWHLTGRYFACGLRVLLRLQPGLKADFKINLPPRRLDGERPCILIANHRSHLDVFLFLSQVPNIRVVAKKPLFRIPFLGMMMRLTRQIPLARGGADQYWKTMLKVERALNQGDPVLIFPEMTRCPVGLEGVQAFHLAPFHMAMRTGVPIIPVVVKNTDLVWPKGVFGMNYDTPVSLTSLEPMYPSDHENASALQGAVQDAITRELSC